MLLDQMRSFFGKIRSMILDLNATEVTQNFFLGPRPQDEGIF